MRRVEVPVAVVGAGAAGLAAAACLEKRDLRVVVFERDAQIGARWARRYERLCLHTVRRFSGLPYEPMPRHYPRYVPKELFARYLEEYARRLRLDVRLGESVEQIHAGETRGRPAWSIGTTSGTWTARAVVVATGRHNEKRLPQWPGAETFSGRLLHSEDYRTGGDFKGQRALVIGLGNSGAEIAADLVEQGAESVSVAVRTTPPITAREIVGVPVQLFGIALMPFPPRLVDRLGARMRRLGTGDLRPYGLGDETWGPFTARRPPVIDVGFLPLLRAGRISVLPSVQAFTRTGVQFANGDEHDFDAVVAATGFTPALERFVAARGALDSRGLPSSRPEVPGLFFLGYDETPRGALFEANRGARRLAAAVDRYVTQSRP